MAKNRKNESVAVRFGPALKAFIICVIIGGAAVGYVWQKSQIDELGRQVTKRELQLRELNMQNKKLRDHLATLRSPAQLTERVLKLNLGLVMPQPNQVFQLPEPANRSVAESVPVDANPASARAGWVMH
jgi:cell division protein FtsB